MVSLRHNKATRGGALCDESAQHELAMAEHAQEVKACPWRYRASQEVAKQAHSIFSLSRRSARAERPLTRRPDATLGFPCKGGDGETNRGSAE